MNYKDLLNKLPSNWNELTLKQYLKLSPVINPIEEDELFDVDIITVQHVADLDKNIQIISLLTDVAIDVIEDMPVANIFDMISKLSFMQDAPQPTKPTIKFKAFDELSYDAFITFQKLSLDFSDEGILSSAINNLPTMLSVFAVSKDHNEEYFLNQSMLEVIAGFFTVSRNIEKYLKALQVSSYKKILKMQMKLMKNQLIQFWKKVNPLKKNINPDGTIGI